MEDWNSLDAVHSQNSKLICFGDRNELLLLLCGTTGSSNITGQLNWRRSTVSEVNRIMVRHYNICIGSRSSMKLFQSVLESMIKSLRYLVHL